MGRYTNDRVKTDEEWKGFDKISLNDRINAMCSYLLISNQNMEKVALALYNNEKYSQTVSLIHRGYNLKDRNGGKYAPSSKFCREYGEVYQEDIEEFVYTYKHGIRTTDNPGSGIELDEFLKERIAQRQSYVKGYGNDYEDADYYDDEYDSDYEESSFHNNMNYQNSRNNRKTSNNTFSISQYTNRQTNNSFGTENSDFSSYKKSADIDMDALGPVFGIGAIVFVVLALVFNWFNWRSKLLVFISEWIQVVWIFGMLIFLLRIVMGKVDFMHEKSFIGKVVSFLIIGIITYVIVSLFGYLCYYFSMK